MNRSFIEMVMSMRRPGIAVLSGLFACVILHSCQKTPEWQSYTSEAHNALDKKRYEEAGIKTEKALKSSYGQKGDKKPLAEALYRLGNYYYARH